MKIIKELYNPKHIIVITIFLLFVAFAVGYYVGFNDGIVRAYDLAFEYLNQHYIMTPRMNDSTRFDFSYVNVTLTGMT